MPQALVSQLARPTPALRSGEFVTDAPPGDAVAAVAVQVLACRADAGVVGFVMDEVLGAKQLRGLRRRSLVG